MADQGTSPGSQPPRFVQRSLVYGLKKLRHRSAYLAKYYLVPRGEKQVVFILAQARTGSTLLWDYLNSHPDVELRGEILNPYTIQGIRQHGVSKGAVLRHIRYSTMTLPERVCGAKFHLEHLDWHGITPDDLRRGFPGVRFLILFRRSIIKQLVSHQIARATNEWMAQGDSKGFDGKIRIETGEIEQYYREQTEQYRRAVAPPWMPDEGRIIAYEDLVADPQTVFDRDVFPLLNLPRSEIQTKMRKQKKPPLEETIENYAELEAALKQYGQMDLAFPSVGDVGNEDELASAPTA